MELEIKYLERDVVEISEKNQQFSFPFNLTKKDTVSI